MKTNIINQKTEMDITRIRLWQSEVSDPLLVEAEVPAHGYVILGLDKI